MMTRMFQWVLASFLAVLSFLGSSLWYDQRNIADALNAQTNALTQLAQEFHDYLKWNEMRFNSLDKSQEKVLERMNRAGMQE